MTLAVNDDVAKHELSTNELDAISAGLYRTMDPARSMGPGRSAFDKVTDLRRFF